MQLKAFIALPFLTLLCTAATPAADEPIIMAYYYPWYIEGDWSRHGYAGEPVLGTYGTDQPAVVAQHINWCADAGIDALFTSWWSTTHLSEIHMQAALMKAPNLNRVQFAMLYESLGLDQHDGSKDGQVDFAQPGVMAKLKQDFAHLAEHYFKHPQYLKINDRPLIGFYVTRTFKNFGRQHLDELRETVGIDLYTVGDEPFFGEQATPASARSGAGVFDAYTAYNMFENKLVKPGESALAYQSREAFPIFRNWAKEVPFFPGIFPSYADFRGNEKLSGTPEDFALLLDASLQLAERSKRGKAPPIVMITSFNEWWEGTTIEPGKAYGSTYLDVVRDVRRAE